MILDAIKKYLLYSKFMNMLAV